MTHPPLFRDLSDAEQGALPWDKSKGRKMSDMPETILAVPDLGMGVSTGRWTFAGTENVFCNTFYTRSDTIPAMLIEAERRGMMRAIKILELRPTRTERLGGQKFKYIQLGESIEEIRQAAAELETK